MMLRFARRPALMLRHAAPFSSQAPPPALVDGSHVSASSPLVTEHLAALGDAPVQSDPWLIVDVAQNVIEAVHTTTGLPWWATFGLTAIAVRGSLFPLLVYQIKATERMGNAGSEMRSMWKSFMYARMFLPPAIPQKQLEALVLFHKGLKLSWEKHSTHPIQCVATPLIQVPSFILMAYSTREIIRSGKMDGLDTGGFWMFQNLMEADSTFILPALAVGCTYLNFELMGKSQIKIMPFLKNSLQYIPLLSFPFICQLPQGIFFYWIASSWCSFAQAAALRQPAIRSAVGLKELPSAASAVAAVTATSVVPSSTANADASFGAPVNSLLSTSAAPITAGARLARRG
ncbi:Aste57867_18210 [Aphanomyces stellatus]|uniref:Aste57867_18210 protein n=1 Tax=Aphanomyces stellatus TaxID=120398 RepID=A0A485L9H5_9STRA|nr:hypothetical protein As57867_018148 [Aphanomyces stellatus]VFT94948.1 Aste57867_18210 [Aphanomyces stellatus]